MLQFTRLSDPGRGHRDVGSRVRDIDGPDTTQVGEYVYKCIDTWYVYTNSRTNIIKYTYKYIVQYIYFFYSLSANDVSPAAAERLALSLKRLETLR